MNICFYRFSMLRCLVKVNLKRLGGFLKFEIVYLYVYMYMCIYLIYM